MARFRFTSLLAAAAATTLLLAGCSSSGDTSGGGGGENGASVEWTGYSYVGNVEALPYKAFDSWTTEFSAATEGRVKFTMHPGGSLGIQGTDITSAVANGDVHLADDGQNQGSIPLTGLLALPGLYNSADQLEAGKKIVLPEIEKKMTEFGVTLLGTYNYAVQTIWSSKKLTSLDELKGMKIRTQTPEQASAVQALGAQSVNISNSEVAAALQQGLVDGVMTAASGGAPGWIDMLKYNYRLPVNWVVSYAIVNTDDWNRLSKADQDAVKKIVTDDLTKVTTDMYAAEDANLKKFKAENGLVVTEPSAADLARFTKISSDIAQNWAKSKNAESADLVSKVQKANS